MLKTIKKSIKSLDFFGKSTNLLFKNDSYYKTTLGFCFSIILVLLSIAGGVYFTNLLLSHLNPNITNCEQSDNSLFNFDENDFSIAFALQTSNSETCDVALKADIYDMQNLTKSVNLYQKTICGAMTLDHPMYCLDLSENLQGLSANFIKFSISYQKNDNLTCVLPFLSFFYIDNLVNNLNYEHPIERVTRTAYMQTISSFTKTIHFSLQKVEVMTDQGMLIEDQSIFSFFKNKNDPIETILNPENAIFQICFEKNLPNSSSRGII